MGYPSFNTGDVLAAADMNAVGRWRVGSGTLTGVGTAGTYVQNAFSADYPIHKIMFYDIISSAAIAVYLQLANGTTESNQNYYSSGQYVLWATGGGANVSSNNAGNWVLSSCSTAPRSSGEWTLFNVATAVSTGMVAQKQNHDAIETIAGYHNPATSYTGFRIATSSGTVSLKWISYGYKG